MQNKIQLALATALAGKMQKNKHTSNMSNVSAISAATDRSGSLLDPYENEATELDWSGELNSDHKK